MSKRYPGGIITKSPATPAGPFENGTAPGIWTLEQQMQFKQQGVWPLAGNAAPYIEEVFSTYLYTGTGSTRNVINDIDLSGKGGLVWLKVRGPGSASHHIYDTNRGEYAFLQSNATSAESSYNPNLLSAFLSNGFTLGSDNSENASGDSMVSWTFRQQPKFFDVVTYTGTGSNTTIAHSLGSVPGSIIVKRTDTTADWAVYHRSLANTQYLVLNSTAAAATGATWWNSTTPTSAVFSVGTDASVNASGGTYVAYVFAHDAGGFGLTGTDNVISCGSFTTDGSSNFSVNLGYEPQWILAKQSSGSANNWAIFDNMRGMSNSNVARLIPNLSSAETDFAAAYCVPTATGFFSNSGGFFDASQTVIYIAIRRGPMKVPTVGTSVFSPVTYTGTGATQSVTASFPVDLSIIGARSQAAGSSFYDRLRGATKLLIPWATSAESTKSDALTSFASNTAITLGADTSTGSVNNSGSTYVDWNFRRAPGFFDEVCFTGTGSTLVLNHNLTVAPELIIGKRRTGGSYWILSGNFGASTYWYKNDWGANDSSTSSSYSGGLSFGAQPTSTTVTLDNNSALNVSAYDAVLWMWATVAGVSKVGTYTGTGALQTIPCGFTTGARFVLVTRVGVVGNNATYIYDSARGITSSNDPYLLLNTSDAEVTGTNYVDTDTTGFKVTAAAPAGLNASGGNYIFLAIA